MNWQDSIGKTYGRLKVLERVGNNKHGHTMVKCLCACGDVKEFMIYNIIRGTTTSCGCSYIRWKDSIGKTYGRLKVIKRVENKGKMIAVECICSCGKTKTIILSSITEGKTTSCGCYQKSKASEANTTHGHKKDYKWTGVYLSWQDMLKRCTNPNSIGYKNYGGRGITVCSRWLNSFENFLEDMGDREDGLSLDRKDNNGNYEPENCRWATRKEQNSNRRDTRLITYKNEIKCLQNWADEYGINSTVLSRRIAKGWPLEKALTKGCVGWELKWGKEGIYKK